MMNKAELKILKEKIDTEIKSTQKKIEEYSLLCKPIAPENSIGRISRMDAINNKSVVESALRVAKEKIQQLINDKVKINWHVVETDLFVREVNKQGLESSELKFFTSVNSALKSIEKFYNKLIKEKSSQSSINEMFTRSELYKLLNYKAYLV